MSIKTPACSVSPGFRVSFSTACSDFKYIVFFVNIENDFSTYLSQAISSFSSLERNVIVQMDEIHVKSDIMYKGGKIFAPNLDPEGPTRTVFAVMVSSLHKKWSCISRLLPCGSISAEKIFLIIKECIIDIENCGLRVQLWKRKFSELAPQLTAKACFPSSIERQNVRLVLKVFNDLTLSALEIQNEKRCEENRNITSTFARILLTLWKIFNIEGGLKYPSEHVLSSVITLWRILFAIEDNDHFAKLLVHGPARKILVELTFIYMEDDANIHILKSYCPICNVTRWDILRKLIFTTTNCFLANKIKNYNSLVTSRGIEKRKLKKFS
ncbi:Transposable element P transposase [Oopsacas minuta]|uniref:Transposable element P transposase n=1 Tax=Oopsacas minuta TaxID=111878 RepID=A0AAV7KDE3_9METZ|nr:Transposable element P transposase [Oopsacas minuta]